jgi:hypothetical protein
MIILPRIRNANRKARQTMEEEHVFQIVRAICQILSLPAWGTSIGKDKWFDEGVGDTKFKDEGVGEVRR